MGTGKKYPKKMLWFGILIILVGIILILINMGMLPSELQKIIFSWQMLLVVFGVVQLFNKDYLSGAILVSIGMFFISPRVINAFPDFFGRLHPNVIQNFWPLFLIVLGVIIVFGAFGITDKKQNVKQNGHHSYNQSDGVFGHRGDIGTFFNKDVLFSGGQYIVLDPVFAGGELNAVFGSIELDLRKTSLQDGNTYLEINAVFGGITIIVPSDWQLESRVTSVFGGFSDERKHLLDPIQGRRLIITGACVFGGGELKS